VAGLNTELTANNIAKSHAYTLLSAVEISGTKLFKMRNPWSTERYSGPWADNSSEWDSVAADVKRLVEYSDADDGVFFMPVVTFKQNFEVLDMVAELPQEYSDRFLLLDDHRTSSPSYGATVFENNVRHNFTLYSEVAQDVYMTIYVHHARSYPSSGGCDVQWPHGEKRHALKIDGVSTIVRIADGQASVKFTMSAGETKNLHAEFAWHVSGITKDFGLVAHGLSGEVTLEHDGGLKSRSWPRPDSERLVGSTSETFPGSSVEPFSPEAPYDI